MHNNRILAVGSMLIVAGFAVGLVVSAKFSNTTSSDAAPQAAVPQTSRPATAIAAGAGLPDLSTIAELAVKASANISSTQQVRERYNDPFRWMYGDMTPQYATRQQQSLGSGVVVTSDGYILTNNHVVQDPSASIKVALPGREEVPGKVIGVDELTDLAVIKIDATGLTTLPWADSDKVRIAEWVLAIGNPFQFNQTVTLGIVSAIGRQSAQLGTYGQMIQTDAAINPGNSGGALVNSRGELVGINTMIYSRTGGSEGLGFAIPSNLAQRIMKELIANGAVNWGTILDVEYGDQPVNTRVARNYGITTDSVVMVFGLARTSPAARAGLQVDDVILGFNGKPVTDASQLQRLLADAKIGSVAELELFRDGKRFKIGVPVASTQQQRRR
jgi:S1-C subfamily serine protease